MAKHAKRVLSWVLAVTLLTTCAISGLVLPASASEAANLFPNGDFEGFAESTPVITPWGHVTEGADQSNVGQVTAGVGVNGSYGLKMGSTNNVIYVDFGSKLALENGAKYRLSWMAKSGAAKESVSVTLNSAPNTTLINASAKQVKSKLALTAGEWISYYIDFQAGAGAYIHDNGGIIIQRHAADTAEIVFDNFALTKIDDSTDLILNGDFEAGSDGSLYASALGGAYSLLSNETKGTVVQESATNRAMLLKASANGWSSGYFNGSHFVGGESYTVKFSYKGGAFRLYANPASHGSFGDNNGNVIYFKAADEWTQAEVVFNFLESGSNNWAFAFEKKNANSENVSDTYVDNFSIVKVAETPALTGIALDKATAELTVGNNVQLTASAVPAEAALSAVTWTTSDAAVATVADGKVTAVAAGTATITAKAGDFTATCVVTVKEVVSDGNLLVNGDFEQGASVAWGNSAYVQAGVGKDGSMGVRIETTVTEGEASKNTTMYYKLPFNAALKPNTKYIFSYEYKHEGHGFGQLNVYKAGTDWVNWKNSANLTNTEWTTVTVEFTTGAAENMNANTGWEWQPRHVHYTNDPGTGAVYFDNFKLIEKVVVDPTAVSLNKESLKLEVGQAFTLNATVAPENAEISSIEWTTSDAAVATVENGKITAKAAGTATITVKVGTLTATCAVTVVEDDGNLVENGDLELGASVAWGNTAFVVEGAGKDGSTGIKINTEVAEGGSSVWPGPYYKGEFNSLLKPNTRYIFTFDHKMEGKGFSRINILKAGGDWTGWKTLTNLTNAEWQTYTIEFTTGAAENMAVSTGYEWIVEHVQYASTPGTGVAYFDNFTLVEKVVVEPTEMLLNKEAVKLEVGQDFTLTTTFAPENAEIPEVQWSTSDSAVATVANGKIVAKAVGTATITVTTGKLTKTCQVTVVEDDGNLLVNGDFELGASVNWDNSAYVMEGVGKDGSTGLKIETTVLEGESARYPGPYYKGAFNGMLKPNTKYIFTFDYKHEGKGFAQLNVVNKPSDWTGWANSANLTATEWTTVTVEFTTGDAANITDAKQGWEWMPRHVHYANAANYGTGAAYFDNFKLVEKVVVPATAIKLDKATAILKPGLTTTLAVSTEPENAEPPVIIWTTSNANVATVDQAGKVTAVAAGTATITATFGELTATCVVTVKPDDGNIINNGDFANGSDFWGRDQGQKDKILPDAGKEGAGIKLNTKVDASTSTHQTPGVYYLDKIIAALEPDAIYTLSFDYKHEGMGFGQVIFNIAPGKLENGTELKNVALASGDKDWTTMSYTFTTGSTLPNANTGWEWQVRQVQYYDKGEGEGTSWFDNFKLVKVGNVVHADAIGLATDVLDVLPYDSASLAVTTSPAGASAGVLTWVSSDPSVIEVDAKGNIKALKGEGEATITVTNDKGKTASVKIVISEYANIIKNGDFELGGVNWDSAALVKPGIGKDGGFGVEVRHDKESGWSSYYYKGSFVGVIQPATTYIFSIDYYAPSATSIVRTWSYDLGLTTSTGNYKVGKDGWQTCTKIFTTPTDLDLRTGWDFSLVCEASGDPAVVFDNISIKKYSTGVQADSIVLNLDKMTLIPGRTGALTAHATPVEADLNDMTWTSSDENVATVEYGVVTGVGKGTAVITGTTKNGKSATCTVTVSGNDVLVLNGSFDTDDDVWTMAGGAAIAEGEGRVNSNAGKLVKDATIKQVFKGLEAETPYQLFIRYRSASGKASVKLENGSTVLVDETTGDSSLWTNLVFEFETGATVEEDTVLTLTGLGNGPIYVDNVVLAVKASLIDFTVADIIWVGGGHQVKPGTELSFAVTVTNIGVDPVAKDAVIVVDLCKNGEVFQTLEYVCTDPVKTNDSIIVMATAPWAAEKGDWVISARANPTLSILELDDTNNTKQVNLRVNETILEAPKEAADMDMNELTFSDEFDSYDSIDMYATGKDGYKWYVTRSWGAGTVQPNSYTVKDGIISLHDQNPVFNITLSTVDAVSGVGWDYQYGYLETRLRIVYPNRHEYAEGMSGGIPAIWSFPTDKWLERPGKNRHWVEMDWLEYWGRDTERWPQYPDGYYTVTLHDQVQTNDGKQESWKVNSNSYQNGLGDGEWHVMGWLWAYNGVVAYIDGEEVFRITYSEDGTPSCRVRTNAGDMFNDIGAFSYMNQQELCLYIAGAYDKPLELDYVRIWQGGNAEVEPPKDDTENDGDTEIVLDIPAEEFYHNYCTDDWGDPIVKVNEENYLNVIAGAEFWGYLTAERQAEINAMLAANGQPTFEEMMAAANAIANPSPDTGATTVLPIAAAALMPACAAAAWLTRKRRNGKK